MIALIAIVVIILACIAYFYLQCPVLNSVASVFSAIIGVIVAFNFYETLAAIMITKDFMPNWAHSLCFLLLFVITTVVIRIAADQTIPSKIDFEDTAKYIATAICGIAAGGIVSGILIISLAMSPMAPKLPYARFRGSGLKASSLRPAKSGFTDSFTAWLFSQISKGSLSSDKSFAVFHADFIDQIHLNRIKAGGDGGVAAIADENALIVQNKIGVRKRDNQIIIRAGIKRTSFTLSQVRLIYKDKSQNKDTSGKALVAYPDQCIIPGKARPGGDEENQKTDLTEVFSLSGGVTWVDLVFKLPSGSIPVMLQFKQNVVTDLPKTVNETEEIQRQLKTSSKR